ncbi:hypothetical protein F4777DRAFT_68163 [Nemania sp. FL0916]|nr:hypothetical protein F4777DRAFT_68163 [Nemania sp. FL0916]
MGSNLDNATNLPLDDPPPKSSFFSRLAAPLRSRSRNLADFHVRLKEPHRQYSAGDHVQGFVILSVVKPIRVTHLTVALHGYVRAFKNASAAAQLATANPAIISHGGRSGRYHGNGHASLFQDEIVLCGEGRLQASRWEFEFDLQFPDLELPSSIDFERGTIGYFVTATLTRPTTIAPTSSCEARINLVERVDVGLVAPPRERKVFLQTMRRRPKKGKSIVTAVAPATKAHPAVTELAGPSSDRDSARATESPHSSTMNLGNSPPARLGVETLPPNPNAIDIQSEISGESAASNNNSASCSGRGADASGESSTGSKNSGQDDREITATVELLKGGCLPGDVIPVRIKVEHNRYMKSLHGIIVTLYRQGRVDYAPPVSSFTGLSKEDAKELERDEYYPRSKTGLGGLSLSSAGSCSVFRKDLSQAVAPLIVDPATLTANITTAVRVPEDAFPSIRNVPGGLITFKYHVEVIVDLGGRLVGPSSGAAPQQHSSRVVPSASVRGTYGIDLNLLANWNGAIVDTDHIRREKGVISVSFEVVVGTTDSSRLQGRTALRPSQTVQTQLPGAPTHVEGADDYGWETTYEDHIQDQDEYGGGGFQEEPQPHYYPSNALPQPQTAHYDFQNDGTRVPLYVPPPNIPDESNLTDKERARRAEERLLPSQPTVQDAGMEAGPSQASAPDGIPLPTAPGSSRTDFEPGPSMGEEPSVPTLSELEPDSSRPQIEDKRELERRRLLSEASAPPDIPDDYEGAESSAPTPILGRTRSLARTHEPSAPTLDEDNGNEDDGHYQGMIGTSNVASTSEPLPRYER